MTPAAPARIRWALSIALWLATWLLGPTSVQADTPHLAPTGLPGGLFVPSAISSHAPGALIARAEYAHTESVLTERDRHERARASLAFAYAARRWFALSAELTARADWHRQPSDQGVAMSTRVSSRHAFDVGPRWALALAPSVHFPAAEDLDRGFRAASAEAMLVGSHMPTPRSAISLAVGYRHDRSRRAVADPFALSSADRLAAELADYDALLVGALATWRTKGLRWFAEWSWDVGLGAEAPSPFASPMRVSAGVQASLSANILLGGVVGASPSQRPAFTELVRIEPRVWLGLTAGFVFGRGPRSPKPATRSVTVRTRRSVKTQEPEIREAEAHVRVVDRQGTSIVGARIHYALAGEARTVVTDAEATAHLRGPLGALLALRIEADGFEPKVVELALSSARVEREFVLDPALPPGEIKGRVRSLRGPALSARIEVVELGEAVTCDASGRFRIEVPPGSYTVRITAEGHEPQERAVEVEQHGVSILVVDLRKSAR